MNRLIIVSLMAVLGCDGPIAQMQWKQKQSVCSARMYELANATLLFEEKYGYLPPPYQVGPNGHRHSWRVLLLEFYSPTLFESYRFDEPWDSPHNSQIEVPDLYVCPNDEVARQKGHTSYCVVVGEQTAFPEDRHVSLKEARVKPTIMFVEVADSGISWAEPRDVAFDHIALSSKNQSGPYVCFTDTSRRVIAAETTKKELQELATLGERSD